MFGAAAVVLGSTFTWCQVNKRTFYALIGRPTSDGNLLATPIASDPYDGVSRVHQAHVQHAIDQKNPKELAKLWSKYEDNVHFVKPILADYAAHKFPNAADRVPIVWAIHRLRCSY